MYDDRRDRSATAGRNMTSARVIVSVVSACLMLALPRASLAAPTTAVATNDFLNSIGVVSTFPDRGQPLEKTIEMIRYCGFRWVRAGIEGLSDDGPTTIRTFLDLHGATGVKLNWGLVSGGTDLKKLIATGRILAEEGALLAFEGNNEPNNWGVTYQGEKGGGDAASWMAVAKLQRDLYQAVKSDPVLAKYPVWSISEAGAQRDNVGLQFLAQCRSSIPCYSARRPDPDARRHQVRRLRQRAQLHLSSAFALSGGQQDMGCGRSGPLRESGRTVRKRRHHMGARLSRPTPKNRSARCRGSRPKPVSRSRGR